MRNNAKKSKINNTGDDIVNELDLKRFKRIISQLESSGGKFTDHKPMKSGMHKNSTAIGEYGLMPLTIQDVAKMRVRKGVADDMDKRIASMSASEVKAKVPDMVVEFSPEYEKYADTLAEHVLTRYKDPKLAAYAWNQGHYSDPNKIEAMISQPKSKHQKNYLPRLQKAMAIVDRDLEQQLTADAAFATTKGVMEVDPKKSTFARNTNVDLEKQRTPAEIPDYSQIPTPNSFISPSDEYESEIEEPVSKYKQILSKLIDPESISYKKKKEGEDT